MIIPGERVLLRPIQPDDYPTLVEWGNNPELAVYLEGDYPRTVEECHAWYQDGKANRIDNASPSSHPTRMDV